ncbi:hypothetical protein K2X85_13865 [bacterium]|nr:hypothetical protein [bacterium]
MTVCTYDDRAVADQHADQLRQAGLKVAVAPCLLHDPDQPGVELYDLILPGTQIEQAQSILGIVVPTADEESPTPSDPSAMGEADRWFWRMMLIVIGMAGIFFLLSGLGR